MFKRFLPICNHVFAKELKLSNLRIFQHAFATPVTALLISLESGLVAENLSAKQHQLKLAQQSAQRLRQLLETSILDRSTSQSRQRCFNLIESLQELKTFFQQQDLQLVLANHLQQKIILRGNKLYFQEAIINLLNNAFEAYGPKKRGLVLLSANKFEEILAIDIVDFAPRGKTEVIFKQFGGWGVGLPFARNVIAKMFAGKLIFERFQHRGSHISLSLPIN